MDLPKREIESRVKDYELMLRRSGVSNNQVLRAAVAGFKTGYVAGLVDTTTGEKDAIDETFAEITP